MQPSSATTPEIEQIVRVVLQRLAVAGDLLDGVGQLASVEELASDLVLENKLITIATLEGKLAGKQRLRVSTRTVVTPAVVDLLRKCNVQLVRDQEVRRSTNSAAGSTGPVGAARPQESARPARTLVCGSAVWFNSLARHLCPKQATVYGCDDQSMPSRIQEHLSHSGRFAVCISKTPFAASASIQRAHCCTTVLLPGLSDLDCALTQANPQALVLDASRWTVAAIGNLVRTLSKRA